MRRWTCLSSLRTLVAYSIFQVTPHFFCVQDLLLTLDNALQDLPAQVCIPKVRNFSRMVSRA